MMNFFNNVFEIITNPKTFFEKINDENNPPKFLSALLVIILINFVFYTLKYDFTNGNITSYVIKAFSSCISGIILWYIIGFFFTFIAKIINKPNKMKQIMCAFAYSLFPLILFAPIQLIKPIGTLGYFLAVILELIIYFWTIYLMAKAIEITYELNFSRAVMVIFLPAVCSFIFIFWLIEFFSKIFYIFKI